ncbi:inosine-uridine preferring nucleoside hydrolase [Pseudoduganella lurida]|uniref:Inosine-uridine preferring nucleoside hydrolase n=1 Tax=Pseudoduganella lurida TaxID=1036180 RepID=A0A562R0P2_9BURK|nr:DUF1593 domain-containing protein [Pseudoduganella lurida]TWI62621.1 inosine-uridine preferring nucleoside hydrolase [Pseudoduganella lurida]
MLQSLRPALYKTLAPAACAAAMLAVPPGAAAEGPRHRIVVSTDIGGTDPDDDQSMVHLLAYADTFDIEGLISSPFESDAGRARNILAVIDEYEKDYPKLKRHSPGYPAPEALRAVTKQGETGSTGLRGWGVPTEGSNAIIAAAKRDDPRPLWVLAWGNLSDVAQALHDDPSIKPKLRVYWIGGPNKKWGPAAFDYIEREHPDLWMIESNSTYRGWFVGGDQRGDLGNTAFVQHRLQGHGALGNYFAGHLKGTIKMGDTPSVTYLLGATPLDPTRDSWGGHYVRAWERQRTTFDRPATAADRVEAFSIVEFRLASDALPVAATRLFVDGQSFPGYRHADGSWRFLFSPKEAKTFSYEIRSDKPGVAPLKGAFTAVMPAAGSKPSARYANWWTDDPDPRVAEGEHQGAQTVSRWRAAYLADFAARIARADR